MNNNDTDNPYINELREMSEVMELINYRPRTADSYCSSILSCCQWLDKTYHVSISRADVSQLRAYLVYLHRPAYTGGRGLKPRSVNICNCAIKKYFQFVLKKPLDSNDLPLMKIDHPLPSVPDKKDAANLIMGIKNPKHRAILALAYGCALRLTEVITLHFEDVSFSKNLVTIRAEFSKNRCEETVELPVNLREIILRYYRECFPDAKPTDWLFPGQKRESHISKGTVQKILRNRIHELNWEHRGYTFHSLRHAHALAYYLAGADIYQVQIRLRHRSISSTTIYVRLAGKLQERSYIENPFDDAMFRP